MLSFGARFDLSSHVRASLIHISFPGALSSGAIYYQHAAVPPHVTHIYLLSPILTLLGPFHPLALSDHLFPSLLNQGALIHQTLSYPFYQPATLLRPLFIGPHRAARHTNDRCGCRITTTGCKQAEKIITEGEKQHYSTKRRAEAAQRDGRGRRPHPY